MPRADIQVEGLRDLQRELKRLGDDLPQELGRANQRVAQLVVDRARRRGNSMEPGIRKSVESLTASRSTRAVQVGLGGARYPFAAGYEFGSDRFKQFPDWRGAGSNAGYYLYPTIRESTDDIVEAYGEEIDEITRRAFPD